MNSTKILNMKTQYEENELYNMRNDPDNYKWGLFYYNKKDPGFLIPRKTGIGFSPNFANPYSYLVIIGIIIFAVVMGII